MRILCGVDLRAEGHEWIVERLAALARSLGEGTVDLLFATAEGEDPIPRAHALEVLLERLPEERRGRALTATGHPVDLLVRESDNYDVLMVGPREPGAIERMFLGSMASRVIRQAGCAVYVPRGEVRTEGRPRFLAGVDIRRGLPHVVVSHAAQWTRRVDGVLDLAFVEPTRLPYIADSRVRARAEAEWRAAREPDRRLLEDLLSSLDPRHRGEALLREGQPEDALVELSGGYDLVMVGNRDRQGIAGYILGSIAEHVVRRAASDVLTLPTAVLAGGQDTEEPDPPQ